MFSTLWLSSGSNWHLLALALLWHAARLKDICGPGKTVATFGTGAVLAGKIIGLVVLAAMLKDGIGGPVETGASVGKIFCGTVDGGAALFFTLDVIRAVMC